LGLDNAGKTTMLYMLQSDRFTQTDSTIHPHQAEVTIGNIRFNSYDLGGHLQARKTWSEYCGTVDGIIFMVDASDHSRMQEAKKELESLLQMPELQNVPFVVFGNKIDKKESLKEDEFREMLGLPYHMTQGKQANQKNPGARPIEIFMCSVMKRVGYSDGF
jgi:GTP-binding protein SAR1